jgi:DcuC family C4-dicarboxylate transporter
VVRTPPPAIYALLPVIPFAIILTFSKLLVSSIKMDVITAMLISMFISILFELIRKRDAKTVLGSMMTIFDGMGSTFAKVVTLIVAGGVFAGGLKQIGAINTIIGAAQDSGFTSAIVIIIMTLIIAVSAILMGSGNAPFFAFAALAPDVAAKISLSPILMLLPMQLAAGIARSMSPITAAIIAVSGISNVSPVDVVKRTAIPMAGALVVSMAMSFILF